VKKSHSENTVGPWARQKLDGLEAYLHAYTVALKKQSFELVYIDAFAGAGRSKIRAAWADADAEDLQLLDEEFVAAEVQFIEGHAAAGPQSRESVLPVLLLRRGRRPGDTSRRAASEFPIRRIEIQVGDANALIQTAAGRRRESPSLTRMAPTSTGGPSRRSGPPRNSRSSSTSHWAWPSTG
jgi:hypothetical protein